MSTTSVSESVGITTDVDRRAIGGYQPVHRVAQAYLGPLWVARNDATASGTEEFFLLRRIALRDAEHESAREQLVLAAQDGARVRHGNVLRVLAPLVEGRRLGFVYEHAEAEPLRALQSWSNLRSLPFPVAVSLTVVVDVLEGLQAVHETASEPQGAFGGLSPDSVLVSREGSAQLADPCIAGCASLLDAFGANPAKLAYAAPEQVGATAPLGPQTDVFSAGVLLWELLAGRRFVGGSRASIERKLREHKLPSLGAALRSSTSVSGELLAVADAALSASPDHRPQTARELSNLLRDCGHPLAERDQVAHFVGKLSGQRFERRMAAVRSRSRQSMPAPKASSAPPTVAAAGGALRSTSLGAAGPIAGRDGRALRTDTPFKNELMLPSKRPRGEASPSALPRLPSVSIESSGPAEAPPPQAAPPAPPGPPPPTIRSDEVVEGGALSAEALSAEAARHEAVEAAPAGPEQPLPSAEPASPREPAPPAARVATAEPAPRRGAPALPTASATAEPAPSPPPFEPRPGSRTAFGLGAPLPIRPVAPPPPLPPDSRDERAGDGSLDALDENEKTTRDAVAFFPPDALEPEAPPGRGAAIHASASQNAQENGAGASPAELAAWSPAARPRTPPPQPPGGAAPSGSGDNPFAARPAAAELFAAASHAARRSAEAPGAQGPEAQAPETMIPEPQAPEVQGPGAMSPEAASATQAASAEQTLVATGAGPGTDASSRARPGEETTSEEITDHELEAKPSAARTSQIPLPREREFDEAQRAQVASSPWSVQFGDPQPRRKVLALGALGVVATGALLLFLYPKALAPAGRHAQPVDGASGDNAELAADSREANALEGNAPTETVVEGPAEGESEAEADDEAEASAEEEQAVSAASANELAALPESEAPDSEQGGEQSPEPAVGEPAAGGEALEVAEPPGAEEPAQEAEAESGSALQAADFATNELTDEQLASLLALENRGSLEDCAVGNVRRSRKRAERRLSAAQQALIRGEVEQARQGLCEAQALGDPGGEASQHLARLALQVGDAKLAERWARTAAKRASRGDPEALALLGDALAINGEVSKARKLWLKTSSQGNRSRKTEQLINSYGKLGRQNLARFSYAQARTYLRRAFLLSRGSYDSSLGFIEASVGLQDLRLAEVLAWRAVLADPQNADIQMLFGDVLHATGDRAGAMKAWRASNELRPGRLAAQRIEEGHP